MRQARSARIVALVIVGTVSIWLIVQVAGPRFGWSAHVALAVDAAAIVALAGTLAATWRIWRRGR